ncbi:MAG: manganese efflux pump MntP family protein [Oscillospiraceae bacterium]|jgi:putative Mn2+ efflux pump MntP|nr:manganese efflux pump MntP family protein [Oscillospiraceae bacterium]
MLIIQIIFLAFGLSADAFAVAVTNGMSQSTDCGRCPGSAIPVSEQTKFVQKQYQYYSRRQALKVAVMFGFFQAIMPLLGFLLGMVFVEFIDSFAHWVAFVILAFIGGRMIYEVRKTNKSTVPVLPEKLSLRVLFIQAVATSIDALVAGISFIAMGIRGAWVFPVIATIGAVTFVMSFLGVGLGLRIGGFMGAVTAKIVGGLVLIALGLKILLENILR